MGENYSGPKVSGNDNVTTAPIPGQNVALPSPCPSVETHHASVAREFQFPNTITRQFLVESQERVINTWATQSVSGLAASLANNMDSIVHKAYARNSKSHKNQMAKVIRSEQTPIVRAELKEELRHTVHAELRQEELPKILKELREEALNSFAEPMKQRIRDDIIPYQARKTAQADQEVQLHRDNGMKAADNEVATYRDGVYDKVLGELKEEMDSKRARQDHALDDLYEKKKSHVGA